jgi:hypothetical protein
MASIIYSDTQLPAVDRLTCAIMPGLSADTFEGGAYHLSQQYTSPSTLPAGPSPRLYVSVLEPDPD